jgi:transcriptional regulator NrdR family protein
MRCPKCGKSGGQTKRTEQRQDKDGWSMVVRERKCSQANCGHIFPTFECYEYADVEVLMRMREAMTDAGKAYELAVSGVEALAKGLAALRQIDQDARPAA